MLHKLIDNLLIAWRSPRWRWALLIAVLSDALGFAAALVPPLLWALDALTAGMLFAILGFPWALLTALVVEVVPGLELFPFWTLAVLALASATTGKSPRGQDAGLPARSGAGMTTQDK
jgi:hypothetical protein